MVSAKKSLVDARQRHFTYIHLQVSRAITEPQTCRHPVMAGATRPYLNAVRDEMLEVKKMPL